MIKYSIIMAVHNAEQYLTDALESILGQTYSDFELICVDDASPDASLEILQEFEQKDSRITLISKQKNEGQSLAQAEGLKVAKAPYVLFFDADDYVEPTLLEKVNQVVATHEDLDMVIFGAKILDETSLQTADEGCYALKHSGSIEFLPQHAFDMNVELWNKVFKKSLIDEHDIICPGTTFENASFLFKYAPHCKKIFYLEDKLYTYRQRDQSDYYKSFITASEHILSSITLCNDLFLYYKKYHIEDYNAILTALLIRNTEYALKHIKDSFFTKVCQALDSSPVELKSCVQKANDYLTAEQQHVATLVFSKEYKKLFDLFFGVPKVKILISCHTPSKVPSSNVFIPIHVGRSIANEESKDGVLTKEEVAWMNANMIGDDTGDNISSKNRRYAELTAQYWAWKNQESLGSPDYIGFMHYRRHFVFNDSVVHNSTDPQIYCNYFDQDYLKRFGLDDHTVKKSLTSSCDGIIVQPYAEKVNIYEHFNTILATRYDQDPRAFDIAISTAKELYPEYIPALEQYLSSNNNYWMNMYIFKKELFDEYMGWLFSILFVVEKQIDFSSYSVQGQRVLGYIAERLLGIFITHKKTTLKFKKLLITHIKYCQAALPQYSNFEGKSIPVVFSTDAPYAQYFAVTLQSIIRASKPENKYDIFVIDGGILPYQKEMIASMVHGRKNFHITYININQYLDPQILQTFRVNGPFKVPTYYRFFIGEMFKNFDKVIYLDCDLIIQRDIADLYDTDMQGCLIAATRCIASIRMGLKYPDWDNYMKTSLLLENIKDYIQAGVLLLNARGLYRFDALRKLLTRLKEVGNPRYVDQDILSSVFQGRISFLPFTWNYTWGLLERFAQDLDLYSSPEHFDAYVAASKKPYIIHYITMVKPWNCPPLSYGYLFWQVARETPFYEYILFANVPGPRYPIPVSNSQVLAPAQRTVRQKFERTALSLMPPILANVVVPCYVYMYKKTKRLFSSIKNPRQCFEKVALLLLPPILAKKLTPLYVMLFNKCRR